MGQINYREETILLKEESKLAQLWEDESCAYNSMMSYLEEQGILEKDLIKFAELLLIYIQKSKYYSFLNIKVTQ